MRIFHSFLRLIRLLILIGLFGLFLIVGMSIGGFYLLDYLVTGETVTVPNLYGQDESSAIKTLAEYDLSFTLMDDPQERTDIDPGLIISQRPAPGSEVKKGRKIILVISKGQKKVFVPDFTGRQMADMRSDLRSAGLEIGQKAAVYHPTIPADTVIAQEPLSGQRTLNSLRVNLLVSLGPRVPGYMMPNLVGMDLDSVRKRISNEPFDLPEDGIQYQRTTDFMKLSHVIEQIPAAGTRMQENDHIQVTIGSSGIEIANLRMITVTFPIPANLYRGQLILTVWDDISSQFESPVIYPLDIQLWETSITKRLLVVGDAWVSLCRNNEFPDIPVFQTYYSQYFPADR